jgi:hypothetical protein
MSERIYIDPVARTSREERALFNLIKKLDKSVGQFTRLGVITYCRSLAEGGYLSQSVLEEFNKVMQRDSDYLERLRDEKIKESLCQTELLTQEPKPEQRIIRVYNNVDEKKETIPEDKFDPVFHHFIGYVGEDKQ